ncbi:hypothetical protein BASA62_000299 [Batrachochytrium salamandrivorans]|nr:hypothetical protein BASA62_000299 [Batrachochytrium salamandrivorans]
MPVQVTLAGSRSEDTGQRNRTEDRTEDRTDVSPSNPSEDTTTPIGTTPTTTTSSLAAASSLKQVSLETLMAELQDISQLQSSTSESLNISQLMHQLDSAGRALDSLDQKTDGLLARLDQILADSGAAEEQLVDLDSQISASDSPIDHPKD